MIRTVCYLAHFSKQKNQEGPRFHFAFICHSIRLTGDIDLKRTQCVILWDNNLPEKRWLQNSGDTDFCLLRRQDQVELKTIP
jgi:hypothetical protein